jgi:hypothetical protein
MSSTTVLDRLTPQLGFDPLSIEERLATSAGRIAFLRKQEANVIGELAAYHARFDGHSSSHYEHERSSFLSQLIQSIRSDKETKGEKTTEAGLEREARAHPTYITWLYTAQNARLEMEHLEAQLAQIRADIEAAKMEREDALVRSRLNEELLRFLRAEMGLSA